VGSVSIPKLRRDNMEDFPFSRSEKRLVQSVHSHPQEPKTLQKGSSVRSAQIRDSNKG
jgi:hypothetical protein